MKYSDYIKLLAFGALTTAILCLTGCTLEEVDMFDYGKRPSDCLAFTVGVNPGTSVLTRNSASHLETIEEEWPLQMMSGKKNLTRGSLTNYLGGEAGVIGFQYSAADGSDRTPIAEGDNNVGFTFSGDQLTSTSTTILWKSIEKANLNLYAYAPKTVDGLTAVSTAAPPVLSYTVPNDIASQTDIIVSKWRSIDQKDAAGQQEEYKNKTIHLTFDHVLTAIRLRMGFDCTVKSVTVSGVYAKGDYNLYDSKWTVDNSAGTVSYTVDFGADGKAFKRNDNLISGDNTLILLPQTLSAGAKITLQIADGTPTGKEMVAEIGGKTWEPGKLITYTLHEDTAPETIYFDLALGKVTIIGNGNYSGYVWEDGKSVAVSGPHKSGNHYYVYQSTDGTDGTADNRNALKETGAPPKYPEVIAPNGLPWREFITNNDNVESVIDVWCKGSDPVARDAGRRGTDNWIDIQGDVTCDLTIDNIYTTYQDSRQNYRLTAGITFRPVEVNPKGTNAKLIINILGDNRIGAVHYYNPKGNENEIIFEGTGSLTIADVDGKKGGYSDRTDYGLGPNEGKGYVSNFWCAAIGGSDDSKHEISSGIVINSGIIFAGTTKAENCTAIGGGGNVYGKVTINGGTVTAVATTTGTAIGGGIGFGSPGGEGEVFINGGNVYAYNHANKWSVPSSAIGGAGSRSNYGEKGTVNISGGYVYAYSALGTAIGGGSSSLKQGGDAIVNITGGEVIAKTGSVLSASIGGGTAYSSGNGTVGTSYKYSGGDAKVTISGNPIIRTGSIGGGGTGDANGHIGNAVIDVSGGDTQAQFLLAAGTGDGQVPEFTMSGGMIRNSKVSDTEYLNVKQDGGAVYLENGKVTISGGKIQNCSAEHGGAIYIYGSKGASNASFTMTGGEILNNESTFGGGAIYITDGTATLSGGTIEENLAAGGNGGGIYMHRGSLMMEGSAKIQNNATEIRRNSDGTYIGGNGGGIYVFSDEGAVDVNLVSGMITSNTADRKGAGVCVDMQNSDNVANIVIGAVGGSDESISIVNNHSLQQGGGLYARGTNAHVTINSGTIMNNTVSQYVYNQNVANELGTVVLNGGVVTHNEVRFHINDGSDPKPEPVVQKIVTSTNTKLVAPVFSRTGYVFDGWNTKANGKGKNYENDQIMNINTDIDLYAKWKSAVSM